MKWDKDNKIKNLPNGQLHEGQTQEQYIENIPEVGFLFNGEPCPHPEEDVYKARCAECGAYIPIEKDRKKPLLKESTKKKKSYESKSVREDS